MGKKKILILTGYFKGETYGLLGPQMAATIINDHSEYEAIVVGVTNDDNKDELKTAIEAYFDGQRNIVAFASLGGRPDLFEFARELKDDGAVTFLAGPQAGSDYKGEVGWESFPHRFKGFSDAFTFALHGPGQQIVDPLNNDLKQFEKFDGILSKDNSGKVIENKTIPWGDAYLSKVDWQILYLLRKNIFVPLTISCAQVLQQIGCQHAAKQKQIEIDYPEMIQKEGEQTQSVSIDQRGCSFCDVATDKGYMGALSDEAVASQLLCLPDGPDRRKIPFELINESPLVKLSKLFEMADELEIKLSQVNLTLRADYLLKGISKLEKALNIAQQKNVRVLLSSIGFEAFDDSILKNLNKGVTRQTNLDAIKVIRSLKQKFPAHLGYIKEEGANHGFIHPTPWDNEASSYETNKTISMYQLAMDILPPHSTPLIIHHASGLADWIRKIEVKENIEFSRVATTIGWWQVNDEISP